MTSRADRRRRSRAAPRRRVCRAVHLPSTRSPCGWWFFPRRCLADRFGRPLGTGQDRAPPEANVAHSLRISFRHPDSLVGSTLGGAAV